MLAPGFVGMCKCVNGLALLIQDETRTRHILLSLVAPLAPPYFPTLSHKRHNFREKCY